jgi:beta-galactosidase
MPGPLIAGALLIPNSPAPNPTALAQKPATFGVKGRDFVLNGRPFQIRSGEMHYPRIPRAYWRDRMRKAKAMGLNTVCTYVFWNLHEPRPGQFDFRGNLDLGAFLKTAREEGLYAIVRPGPYICTELDFGGFPAWLLKDPDTKVRTWDETYLAAAKRYLAKVGTVVRPHLLKHGGPVLMAQVENEYGSFGEDHRYMAWVRDTMKASGFDCQLFTSDGPGEGMLRGGTLADLPPTVNFGGGAESAFRELEKFRPGSPRMIGEYWCGWFDHWGKRHHRTSPDAHVKDIAWCMANGASFNLYMFHGGTNFGYMQGSNGSATDFQVDTTSYDYDAPLDEAGRMTPKYHAFRNAIAAGLRERLPAVPTSPPPIAIGPIPMKAFAPMLADLPKPIVSDRALKFEELGQSYGSVLYEFTARQAGKRTLRFENVKDYATVFVDGRIVGTLDRRKGERAIDIETRPGSTVRILVESLSRINFGRALMEERKGLYGPEGADGPWRHFVLPTTPPKRPSRAKAAGPLYYRGTFNVARVGDTFLDMRSWGKGFVWVNGHNLGRFWSVGPQGALFLPGAWLRPRGNEIFVLSDMPHVYSGAVLGLREPLLDVMPAAANAKLRKAGQNLSLTGTPTGAATFAETDNDPRVDLKGAKGRYLAIKTVEELRSQPYATLAELFAFTPDGKALPRDKWKVLYADSEETDEENGSAKNILDNQPTTFWHTQWGASQPKHPHYVVIDFGESVAIGSLQLLPRRDGGTNGRLRSVSVYLSETAFPGI